MRFCIRDCQKSHELIESRGAKKMALPGSCRATSSSEKTGKFRTAIHLFKTGFHLKLDRGDIGFQFVASFIEVFLGDGKIARFFSVGHGLFSLVLHRLSFSPELLEPREIG